MSAWLRSIALAATWLLLPGLADAQQETLALVGATLRSGDGPAVADATVVLRDGVVVAAGADVRVPSGATRVELPEGAVITPGFVAVGAPLGLVEISL
ncbi:MAG: hypothetical protein AAGH15_20730 [Myxococcota bacterium]